MSVTIKPLLLAMIVAFFTACQTERQGAASAETPHTEAFTTVTVRDSRLNEISGIAASRKSQRVFWVHNDSGDKARIFAIDNRGKTIGQVLLSGIKAVDWEDIATGPGPQSDSSYIYIGDIGDNRAIRDFKVIYRLSEPDINKLKNQTFLTVSHFATIRFRLPDGARDCETLMCDPLSKNLYIVSKRENRVHVYELPFPQDTLRISQAKFLTRLPVTQITAGDIASSGRHIILKNYLQIFYFPRAKGQSVKQALSHFPSFLPYKEEPQGEALCFACDESGYYTISEMRHEPQTRLYFYPYKFKRP